MLTYYGNLFSRANTDPYHNSHPSGTQFRVNGYSDVDRRWSDRGNLYVADGNDSHPGVVRLKFTPTLGVAAPGPDSLRTGILEPAKPCCDGREVPEDEEDKRDCVADAKNFLDSLPTPDEYRDQLLETDLGGCGSSFLLYLCNYYKVIVWHCTVKCVWIGGTCYNCNPGDTGELCLCQGPWWCEEYIFSTCAAAVAFLRRIEPQLSLSHPVAVVGQDTMIATNWFTRCDDDLCEGISCLLFLGRNSPVAYTAGVKGDGDCGGGEEGRQPASDDSAWVKTVC